MPKRNQKEEIVKVRIPRRGQLLGEIEKLQGGRRMTVKCVDGHTRLCRIPGKLRRKIQFREGDIVLIEPWKVQENERGDVLWRYFYSQANWLRRKGYLKGLEEEI